MGTAGNRKGNKVFSINTTIRNPQRNIDFLKVISIFNGLKLDKNNKIKIYYEFIKNGVYIPNIISNETLEKIENKIPLEDNEVAKIINDNPQKLGNNGRVMTQIRALKDLEFITLRGKVNEPILNITDLGNRYLNGEDVEIVYTKSLAWYYYTVERPDTISEIEHSTLYSKRPNKDNFMYKGIIKNNILLFIPPILHKIYLAIKKSF